MPEEVELYKREQVEDMICEIYGGRAAEELFLKTTTTGAQDDLQKAVELAKKYVGLFGMSKDFGTIAGLNYLNPMLGMRKSLFSSGTSWRFDKAVQELCKKQYQRACELLKTKAKEVNLLMELLLKKETIELNELTELLGKPESQEKEGMAGYREDLNKRKEQETSNATEADTDIHSNNKKDA